MRFVFRCLVRRHAGGRVTAFPLDFPELGVHAADLDQALEVLALALDDRISRAHPRRLPDFARPAAGELAVCEVPLLKVRGAERDVTRPLRLGAVVAPAHRPYTEVRAPRLGARFWVTSKQPVAAAGDLLAETLADTAEDSLLDLRLEAPETLVDLTLEATPLRLAELRRRELHLDERAPPRPPGDEVQDDDEEEDDDWVQKRRRAPKKPRRAPTPTLRRLGVAWHELVAEDGLDPAWERDDLVEDLRRRVEAELPDPVVLVGAAGAGKTAILHELARRVSAAREDPRPFFFVDGSRLIAGEGFLGDWQRQTLDAWREAHEAKAVLYLGRAADLLEAGKSAHSDQNVAQLLAPLLAAREVAVVAEATVEEWALVERRDAAFARAFAVLAVPEPPPAATERILARLAAAHGETRGIAVEPGAVAEGLALCARFLPYGALVGNAAAFLRRLIDLRAHALARRVAAGDATALFSAESGIPLALLRDDVPLDEAETRAFLAARVHGQDAAVARVARAVTVIKANLADRGRPSAVLLFAGPTGVGKTELAKALAELVFGARERLLRLDMGEYAGPDALARLLGEPGAPGHLTQAVRRQPFSLVLLDEIEKAHPAVFDALLGVLGEGRLTGGDGKLADFRASLIVMTSNLGAETFRGRPGFGGDALPDAETHYRAAAAGFFRPELYNRLDDVVVFRPLGAAELRTIVDRELARVTSREGLRRRDVELVVDEDARARLAEIGLDPRYGARPLKRAIERHLVAPVAAWLAEHPPGGAVRLTAGAAGLSAESLGEVAGAGVSRAALARLLERAAAVRGEVRRWSRSGAMRRLRHELAFFDRLSRQPSFWHDRAIADESALAAAEGRELERLFSEAERQAEAAEDLAYEAWYARQPAAAAALETELDAVSGAMAGLKIRLFASLFPPRGSVGVMLVPGKGAWERLLDLVHAWSRALRPHGALLETYVLAEKEVKEPGKKPRVEERWRSEAPSHTPALAVQVVASGPKAILLLSAEHGAHRFVSGAQTSIVRCRFELKPARYPSLPPLEELERRAPSDEIRRVRPARSELRDLRLERSFTYEDPLEVDEVWRAWLDRRVLGEEEP
jgi:ATP-dependent Clp protease ATP-binding subunit ClpC